MLTTAEKIERKKRANAKYNGRIRKFLKEDWRDQCVPMRLRQYSWASDHPALAKEISQQRRYRPAMPQGFVPLRNLVNELNRGSTAIKLWCERGMPHSHHLGKRIFQLEAVRSWLSLNVPRYAEGGRVKVRGPSRHEKAPLESGTIYAICHPVSGDVRYIGKATNFKRRKCKYLNGHIHNEHLRNWFAKLNREGLKPEFRVLEECLFALGEAEKKWIAHGRERGWDLINHTDGGEACGFSLSEEAKRASSERAKRRHADPVFAARFKEQMIRVAAKKKGMTVDDYLQWKAHHTEEARAIRRREREALRLSRIAAADQRKAEQREQRKREFGLLVPLTYKGAAFIPLVRGLWAVIDAEDWERVGRFHWHLDGKGRPKRSFGHGRGELLTRRIMRATKRQMVRIRDGNHLNCRKSNLSVCNITT